MAPTRHQYRIICIQDPARDQDKVAVGIINSGYRDNIIAAFDNISDHDEVININSHLVQICSPTLEPFMISIADT